ncbi:unnamed protein product [Urochloa humidicola]
MQSPRAKNPPNSPPPNLHRPSQRALLRPPLRACGDGRRAGEPPRSRALGLPIIASTTGRVTPLASSSSGASPGNSIQQG